MVQGRDHLPAPRQGVHRLVRRRHRRLRRAHGAAGLHRRARRDGDLAAAVLPVARCATTATTSPLRGRSTRLRHAARLRAPSFARRIGAACASSPSSSSTTPATSTRGSSSRAPAAATPKRDWYVWSDTDQQYARRADHLHRHRDEQLDLGRGAGSSTTGIASSATSPTSTSTTRRSSRPSCGSCASGSTSASTGCASTRCRTSSSAREPTARTCRRPTPSCGSCARTWTSAIPDRMLLAEANQWPPDVAALLRHRRRAGVPHGVPLPAHAAHLDGAAPRGPLPDRRDHGPDAGDPRRTASGRSSCATTTS